MNKLGTKQRGVSKTAQTRDSKVLQDGQGYLPGWSGTMLERECSLRRAY